MRFVLELLVALLFRPLNVEKGSRLEASASSRSEELALKRLRPLVLRTERSPRRSGHLNCLWSLGRRLVLRIAKQAREVAVLRDPGWWLNPRQVKSDPAGSQSL